MLLLLLWLAFLSLFFAVPRRSNRGHRFIPAALSTLRARKPDWVIEEIVRLKALMADAGCGRIADTFNRIHAARHRMTVSKTWVATTVRGKRLEIEQRRREWKRRIPQPMATHVIWGVDRTGKMDTAGALHPVLGIIDHGSRLAVTLRRLADKSTIALLRALLDAIWRPSESPSALPKASAAMCPAKQVRPAPLDLSKCSKEIYTTIYT